MYGGPFHVTFILSQATLSAVLTSSHQPSQSPLISTSLFNHSYSALISMSDGSDYQWPSGYERPSASDAAFDLAGQPRFNANFDQQSVSPSAQPPSSAPSLTTMSDGSGHHWPTASHARHNYTGPRDSSLNFNQQSWTQPHSLAPPYGPSSMFSSSNRFPWQNVNHRSGDPSAWGTRSQLGASHSSIYRQPSTLGDPSNYFRQPHGPTTPYLSNPGFDQHPNLTLPQPFGSTSSGFPRQDSYSVLTRPPGGNFGLPSGVSRPLPYGRLSVLGDPSTSSGQPQWVNDAPPNRTPETNKSMISDSLEEAQQESSFSNVSAGHSLEVEVSQASVSDLARLLDIYADASIDKALNCCIAKGSLDVNHHHQLGCFPYDQALTAANADAVIGRQGCKRWLMCLDARLPAPSLFLLALAGSSPRPPRTSPDSEAPMPDY